MAKATSKKTGGEDGGLIDEMIRMSDFSYDRLPMIEIIGERLAEYLSLSLPDLTQAVCETSLDKVDYVPLSQLLDDAPEPVLAAVCRGKPLDGEIMLTMDANLVMTALELMLGGKPEGDLDKERTQFSAIERGFGHRLSRLVLNEFKRAMSVVAELTADVHRVETDLETANVAQPASLCVRLHLSIAMAGRAGQLELVLPYDALETLRPKLGKVHFGERGDPGSAWGEHINSQIERATVELEAVFAEIRVPIGEIMNWEPGTTLNLMVEEAHEATIVCSGSDMFRAGLGKRGNGNAAIRITEALDH